MHWHPSSEFFVRRLSRAEVRDCCIDKPVEFLHSVHLNRHPVIHWQRLSVQLFTLDVSLMDFLLRIIDHSFDTPDVPGRVPAAFLIIP